MEDAPVNGVATDEVERRLAAVQCAVCKQSRFAIDPRSVRSDGEWKGVCLNCRYTFPVHTDMEFYLRTQPDLPYWLGQIGCPACQHRGVRLDFRINMSVRQSDYFVTCPACRHAFSERSSLEAFE